MYLLDLGRLGTIPYLMWRWPSLPPISYLSSPPPRRKSAPLPIVQSLGLNGHVLKKATTAGCSWRKVPIILALLCNSQIICLCPCQMPLVVVTLVIYLCLCLNHHPLSYSHPRLQSTVTANYLSLGTLAYLTTYLLTHLLVFSSTLPTYIDPALPCLILGVRLRKVTGSSSGRACSSVDIDNPLQSVLTHSPPSCAGIYELGQPTCFPPSTPKVSP